MVFGSMTAVVPVFFFIFFDTLGQPTPHRKWKHRRMNCYQWRELDAPRTQGGFLTNFLPREHLFFDIAGTTIT